MVNAKIMVFSAYICRYRAIYTVAPRQFANEFALLSAFTIFVKYC